jgi:hypothetical protein
MKSTVKMVLAIALVVGCGSQREGFPDATLPNDLAPGKNGDFGDPAKPGAADPGANDSCEGAAGQKSYAGCDFVIPPMPYLMELSRPPCFALFLANNSTRAAKIKVSYGGQENTNQAAWARLPNGSPDPASWPPLPASGIPAKQVAVIYLSDDPTSTHITFGTKVACPGDTVVHEPNGAAPPWPHKSSKTFHVETTEPVTAYDVMPFGGAKSFIPSAELLLPTTAWGDNYVVAIPPLAIPTDTGAGPSESGWVQVVAKENDTKVTLLGTTDFEGPTAGEAVPKNSPVSVTLAAGSYIQWHSWRAAGVKEDMSGSIILANKPVAVFGGDTALRVATKDSEKYMPKPEFQQVARFCCVDSAHQQIPPVSGLGFDYVAAPYATRRTDMKEESILYRFVGVVDGTSLAFDPPVNGAPTSLARGEVVDLEASGAVRIKSQDKNHPFYLGQTMSYSTLVGGGTRPDGDPNMPVNANEGGPRTLGDPEFVNALPPAQFIKEYAFVTDPTYSTTSLVLTRVKEGGAFADVTVDCLGVVSGWKPIGQDYEWTRVDLVRGAKGNGTCQNGAHTATSAGRFGITVWGMDWWASYAYPAGGAVFKINDVQVPPMPK